MRAYTIRKTLNPCRGLTLIECLVFVVIWSSISVTALWTIHEAGLMRSQAAMRSELVLVAQSELEHARVLPPAQLKPGTVLQKTAPWWPDKTSCTVTLKPRSEKTWLIDIQVDRKTARGLKPVRLTSIRSVQP